MGIFHLDQVANDHNAVRNVFAGTPVISHPKPRGKGDSPGRRNIWSSNDYVSWLERDIWWSNPPFWCFNLYFSMVKHAIFCLLHRSFHSRLEMQVHWWNWSGWRRPKKHEIWERWWYDHWIGLRVWTGNREFSHAIQGLSYYKYSLQPIERMS